MSKEVELTYVRTKLSSLLAEVEADSGIHADIKSDFRLLEGKIKGHDQIDILYEVIDALLDCRVFSYERPPTAKWSIFCRTEKIFKKNMRNRLNNIGNNIVHIPPPPPPLPTPPPLPQWKAVVEPSLPPVIVGLEAEAEQIELWLTGNASFRAVGIVGCGGCGKTALAQKLYRSPIIQKEFPHRFWVNFSKFLSGTTEELMKYVAEKTKVPELEGKKYLLVLDGAWNLPPNFLRNDEFKGRGGAVIVTTRRENVVADARPHLLRLEPFTDDSICWEIFSNAVARHRLKEMEPTHPNFPIIQDDVKRNSQGLPLAALSLATLLPRLLSKSYLLRAMDVDITWGDDSRYWRWTSLPKPDQEERVAHLVAVCWFHIGGHVNLKKLLLSSNIYSVHIVYNLHETRRYHLDNLQAQVRIDSKELGGSYSESSIDLLKNGGEESVEYPGWKEMQLAQFPITANAGEISVAIHREDDSWKSGLIFRGFNFRPIIT